MSDTPNIGFEFLEAGQAQKELSVNRNSVILDALLGGVQSRTETAPPGSPTEGHGYIVASPATGVWAGHEDEIAYYFGAVWQFLPSDVGSGHPIWVKDDSEFVRWVAGSPGSWIVVFDATLGTDVRGLTFRPDTGSTADSDPGNGLFKWNNATQSSATTLYVDNQTDDAQSVSTFFSKLDPGGYAWIQQTTDPARWQLWRITGLPVAGSGYYKVPVTLMAKGSDVQDDELCTCLFSAGSCETWAFACSDYKTTALSASTDVGGMIAPYAATLIAISGGLHTAQTSGSTLTVDVNEAGSTLLSTKITWDNTENSSLTAGTPPVISDASIAAGAKITADIDQVGDGTAKGLTVYMRVFRT